MRRLLFGLSIIASLKLSASVDDLQHHDCKIGKIKIRGNDAKLIDESKVKEILRSKGYIVPEGTSIDDSSTLDTENIVLVAQVANVMRQRVQYPPNLNPVSLYISKAVNGFFDALADGHRRYLCIRTNDGRDIYNLHHEEQCHYEHYKKFSNVLYDNDEH